MRILVSGIAEFRVSELKEFYAMSHFFHPDRVGLFSGPFIDENLILAQFPHQSHKLEAFPSLFRIFLSLLHADRWNRSYIKNWLKIISSHPLSEPIRRTEPLTEFKTFNVVKLYYKKTLEFLLFHK